jgi:hypothetical protein
MSGRAFDKSGRAFDKSGRAFDKSGRAFDRSGRSVDRFDKSGICVISAKSLVQQPIRMMLDTICRATPSVATSY